MATNLLTHLDLNKALADYAKKIGHDDKVDHNEIMMKLVAMESGMNVRFFTHDNRPTLILLHTKPEYVQEAVCQIYGAVVEEKRCLISTSRGYRYLVVNLTKLSAGTILGLIFASSNPELIKSVLKIFFP